MEFRQYLEVLCCPVVLGSIHTCDLLGMNYLLSERIAK